MRAALRMLHGPRGGAPVAPFIRQSQFALNNTGTVTTPAFGVAPSMGDVIADLVSSVTTVNTAPAGSTIRQLYVANQGAYGYDDTSTATTRTVIMNGAFNAALAAVDMGGVSGFENTSAVGAIQGTPGQTIISCPGFTTVASANGTLVIAVANMATLGSTVVPGIWDNGFTAIGQIDSGGAGSLDCALFVAYKIVAPSTAIGTTHCVQTGGAADTCGYTLGYTAL